MHGPDGAEYPNWIQYVEVVKPERLVYAHGGEQGEPPHFHVTAIFKALGEKTELTLRSVFPTAAARDHVVKEYSAIEGGEQTLARLGEHLAGEFVLSRLLDAPRTFVWKAWTDPDRLATWFSPKGGQGTSVKMDFRPGGVYHYCLRMADGHEMWGRWAFREIVEPERLVFVLAFSDEKGGVTRHPMSATWPLETLSTILFQDMGGKTLLTIKWATLDANDIERKTFGDSHDGMRQGWGGTLDQLVAHLKEGQ